jgi:hypothetical protein
MSQLEASITVDVPTDVIFKAILISTTSQKRREAVERRMVTEDVVE